jgi:hypothetical protein
MKAQRIVRRGGEVNKAFANSLGVVNKFIKKKDNNHR